MAQNVDLEFEYPMPEGSDSVKEIKRCIVLWEISLNNLTNTKMNYEN
jgi:hypothetical protein